MTGSAGAPPPRHALRLWLTIAVCAGTVACGKREFEPQSDEQRVLEASQAFDPSAYDTIGWSNPDSMLLVGAALYGADCRDCHGRVGAGGTDYAESSGLSVPSLIEPGWTYDGNVPAVRRRIFTGHTGGMPTHGIAGLTAREIDAVARYVVEQLRPEMLQDKGPAAR